MTCIGCQHAHYQTNARRQILWLRPVWCAVLSEYVSQPPTACPVFKAR